MHWRQPLGTADVEPEDANAADAGRPESSAARAWNQEANAVTGTARPSSGGAQG